MGNRDVDMYCAHDSGDKLVKCCNCDGNAENCDFRWTKKEIRKLIREIEKREDFKDE